MDLINETVDCPVSQHARTRPDDIALTDGSVRLSYSELDHKIETLGNAIRERGLNCDNRLAVLGKNSASYAVLILACFRHGICVVPLNIRMNSKWWRESIDMADCSMLFVDDDYTSFSDELSIPSTRLASIIQAAPSSLSSQHRAESVTIDLDVISSIVFTSGSTGAPRGVRLTAGNHYYNAVASNENIWLSLGDCWLAALPFYHVGGMAILFRSAIAESSVHIMADFNARDVNRLIDDGSISHVSVVPAMLDSIIDARQGREFPPTMKAVLLGGAPASRRLIEKTCALKAPLFTTYGMTEAASQICTTSQGDSGDKLLTSGRPLGCCEIRIVAPDGNCLPYGVEGEIQIRGESVFAGYLHENTSEIFLPDGWFNTGDVGLFDDDGYLHVSGRKDAMFVSGGENIHPSAIERIAADFLGVRDCAAIGVDDDTWGARPILFVEPISAGLSIAELKMHLETNLSRLMIPKSIIIIEEMPRSSVGKIDIARLREIFDSTEGSKS